MELKEKLEWGDKWVKFIIKSKLSYNFDEKDLQIHNQIKTDLTHLDRLRKGEVDDEMLSKWAKIFKEERDGWIEYNCEHILRQFIKEASKEAT